MAEQRQRFLNSINLNAETDFPYLVLNVIGESSYPRNPGFQVMHWHEDLQFIYVHSGKIELKTLEAAMEIEAGSGVFINKNIVHLIKQREQCHYNSFLFPDYFLKFYFGSPAEHIVDSIVEGTDLPFCHLSARTGEWEDALSILRQLSAVEKKKTDLYTYEVLVLLSALWLALRRQIHPPIGRQREPLHTRMRLFLQYIEKHYQEGISLKMLADSANVSKSECLRCFKESLQTTPYQYLTEYRLSKAVSLLENTEKTIGEIAESVGFHQASHFGKCFKEKTGYSPREYRKKKQRQRETLAAAEKRL